MKALKIITIVVASLLLLGGVGYLYASSGVKSNPGYVKLAKPKGESVSTLLSLNIGPGGVRPTRWLFEKIVDGSDSEHEIPKRIFKNVLKELQGIQLRIYEVHGNRQVFDEAIAESAAVLEGKNWEHLVTVREENERIVIMQYGDDAQINGLSIMASTPDTALFLNLIGPFDLNAIAETASQVN